MSPQKSTTGGTLADLSSQLASAVETAGNSVVAIHARRRIPSSGVVWRDGIIVSASHTVRRDDDISITLPGGETAAAKIAGRDPATDLIALRVEGTRSHVAARAESDALRVGSLVLAIGRPGRDVTASFGIVSAIGEGWRSWEGGGTRVDRVLRLDLSIYDGFSGGPLVDASGSVLGVNNSALARGMPMALPAGVVDNVVDELLHRGHVRRAYVGVAVHPVALSPAIVKQHNLAQDTALMVMSVADRGPAEKAGIYAGDVVLDANGQTLRRPTDLLDALAAVREGESIQLRLLRAAALKSVTVTPADRGTAEGGGRR
jgi:S1-C subfamily serine protease